MSYTYDLVHTVGIVGCAIRSIMQMHSPQGDEITTGVFPTSSVAMCIIQLYDCMIKNIGPHDSSFTFKKIIIDDITNVGHSFVGSVIYH